MVRNALLLVALFCSLSWTAGAQDLEKIDLCDERISQSKRSDNPNHTLRNWVLDQNQYCMGARAYERGDYAAALSKIRPLAERGHPQALINLGVFAWRGTVIPQSFEAAYTVWGLAFKAGAVTVQAALEEASKKLTSEQLQRAKRTIEKEWKRMQARKK